MQEMEKKEREKEEKKHSGQWQKNVCALNADYGKSRKLESVASLKNIFLKLEYISNNLIASVNTTSFFNILSCSLLNSKGWKDISNAI